MISQETVDSKNYDDIIKALEDDERDGIDSFINEYKGDRKIRDEQVGNRPDKTTTEGPVPVNRLPVQFQKKIVRTASAFLFGEPVRLNHVQEAGQEESEEFLQFLELWEDLRMDSKLLLSCERTKAETQSALLFRALSDGKVGEEDKGVDVKLKATVLLSENGKLLPGFNEFGEMVAFGYQITAKVDGKDITRTFLYNDTNVVIIDDDGKTKTVFDDTPHFFNRIPVVYISQEEPEWYDVKELIDRYETSLSKFCDTNDYFASPYFKAVGKIENAPQRDDQGKVYMLDIIETDSGTILNSDLSVVSWDQSVEAVELEFDTIKGLIYELTDTPNLSFDNVKGIGTISGIALKLMFLASMMKAKFSEAIFKTAVERVVNIMRAGMVHALTLAKESFFEDRIDVEFQSILPTNEQEMIAMLTEAAFGKPIMSQKTAVMKNPLVDSPDQELAEIQGEAARSLGEPGIL